MVKAKRRAAVEEVASDKEESCGADDGMCVVDYCKRSNNLYITYNLL